MKLEDEKYFAILEERVMDAIEAVAAEHNLNIIADTFYSTGKIAIKFVKKIDDVK